MKTIALSVVVLLACASVSAQESRSIGYRTVAEAYTALRKDSNAKFSTQKGWVLVEVRGGRDLVFWTFTPNTYSAYPAAIKRTFTEVRGAWYVTMQSLCEAAKPACDQMFEEFKQLNEQMKRDIQNRHKSSN